MKEEKEGQCACLVQSKVGKEWWKNTADYICKTLSTEPHT